MSSPYNVEIITFFFKEKRSKFVPVWRADEIKTYAREESIQKKDRKCIRESSSHVPTTPVTNGRKHAWKHDPACSNADPSGTHIYGSMRQAFFNALSARIQTRQIVLQTAVQCANEAHVTRRTGWPGENADPKLGLPLITARRCQAADGTLNTVGTCQREETARAPREKHAGVVMRAARCSVDGKACNARVGVAGG
jgi:hypothetical protein